MRDRERLEERSRDAVSAWKFPFYVSNNLFSSSFFLFFLLSPLLFVLSQPPFSSVSYCKTGDKRGERLREARGAQQRCCLSFKVPLFTSLTICSLLSFFLFFLLSPLLSFSNNLHSPHSLIAKQTAARVRDHERLEERRRDEVSD